MTEQYYSKADMRRFARKVLLPIFGILAMIFIVAPLLGFFIMFLWNATVADIFNVKEIGFWQAVGIFILAKFLFGFGGSSGNGSSRRKKNKKEKRKLDLRFEISGDDDARFKDYWRAEGKAGWEAWKKNKDGDAGEGKDA